MDTCPAGASFVGWRTPHDHRPGSDFGVRAAAAGPMAPAHLAGLALRQLDATCRTGCNRPVSLPGSISMGKGSVCLPWPPTSGKQRDLLPQWQRCQAGGTLARSIGLPFDPCDSQHSRNLPEKYPGALLLQRNSQSALLFGRMVSHHGLPPSGRTAGGDAPHDLY